MLSAMATKRTPGSPDPAAVQYEKIQAAKEPIEKALEEATESRRATNEAWTEAERAHRDVALLLGGVSRPSSESDAGRLAARQQKTVQEFTRRAEDSHRRTTAALAKARQNLEESNKALDRLKYYRNDFRVGRAINHVDEYEEKIEEIKHLTTEGNGDVLKSKAALASSRSVGDEPTASQTPRKQLGDGRYFVGAWFVVSAALLGAGLIASFGSEDSLLSIPDTRWHAAFLGALVVAIVLLVVFLIGNYKDSAGKHGLYSPLVREDGRVSTSQTQLAMWTIAVGYFTGYQLFRVAFDELDLAEAIPSARFDEYIVLLGGPLAAAVISRNATSYKLQNGTLQRTKAPSTDVSQLVTDDDGRADLVDVQYLLFNMILLAYFIITAVQTNKFPELPWMLLALTGAGGAVYTANKMAAANLPLVTSVVPSTCKPGQRVLIYGTNLKPGGSLDRLPTATLSNHSETLYLEPGNVDGAAFELPVPPDVDPGHHKLRVTSSAGVESAPFNLEVLSIAPRITSVKPERINVGERVNVTGENLVRDGADSLMRVDGMLVAADFAEDGSSVSFLPTPDSVDTSASSIEIEILVPSRETVTVSVPVQRLVIEHAWKDQAELRLVVRGHDLSAGALFAIFDEDSGRTEVRRDNDDMYVVELPSTPITSVRLLGPGSRSSNLFALAGKSQA
jgi:hypothetical protein